MTARARKSLLGILSDRLDDAVVLDLYCGVGTMGLEALSGGAKRCFFAERDPRVLQRLRRNIETLQAADRAKIWTGNLLRTLVRRLEQLTEPVDLAFVDPPFAAAAKWDWKEIHRRIFAPLTESLAPDGCVVLRLPAKTTPPEEIGTLRLNRQKQYGQMVVGLYGLVD